MKKMALLTVLVAVPALAACSDQYHHQENASQQNWHNAENSQNMGDRDMDEHGEMDHGYGMHHQWKECWENKAAKYWFDRMDTNHNGTISRSEYMTFARKMFNDADTRHAGRLTLDDLKEQHKREWKRMESSVGHMCKGHHDMDDRGARNDRDMDDHDRSMQGDNSMQSGRGQGMNGNNNY